MSTPTRRIGKYELQKFLGSGSVGEVWKSYDLQYRRHVAIKIIHTDLQSDSNFMHHLLQEGQAIASLHHPNIVRILDANIARPKAAESAISYIVMEHIEGPTLAYSIRNTSRRGDFPPLSDIVYLFTQLGGAIDHAYEHGIIHGNIKPANILLRLSTSTSASLPVSQIGFPASYREPVLTDFGTARPTNSSTGNSALYISPEQAKGLPPTHRSDIYSLGVILYEICTGVLPFEPADPQGRSASSVAGSHFKVLPFRSESPVILMMQHINMQPTPPMLINTNIPLELSAVILRALAKDPAARFSNASQMAAALAAACSVHSELYSVIIAAEAPGPGYNMLSSAPTLASHQAKDASAANQPSNDAGASTATRSGLVQGSIRPDRQLSVPPTLLLRSLIQVRNDASASTASPSSDLSRVSYPAGQAGRAENEAAQLPLRGQAARDENAAGQLRERLLQPRLGDDEGHNQALWKEREPYSPVPAWAVTRAPTRQVSFTGETLKELDTPPTIAAVSSSRASLSLHHTPLEDMDGARGAPLNSIAPTTRPLPVPTPKMPNRLSPIYFGLAATLSLVILGTMFGTLSWLHTQSQQTAPTSNVVGHVSFQDDPSGHNDVLSIELQNIPVPPAGKSYYAWLFNNDSARNQAVPILLGKLTDNSGHLHFLYPGDAHHSDLLASASSLLITEEDANDAPDFPSIHQLYAVEFAQATHPTNANHASVLVYLRDLLSGEQQLSKLGVSGGLALWLLRNTSKAWLWASNARDYWEGSNTDSSTLNFIRGQLVHILDVLEGQQFDPRDAPIARVALLEQNADAPDYLDASLSQLNAIAQSEDATADQKVLAHTIQVELQQVKSWLQKVHADTIQLLNMTDLQFMQPQTQSLLNDTAMQANYAYNGQSDLSSNSAHQAGMAQIYTEIERLATFDVIRLKA